MFYSTDFLELAWQWSHAESWPASCICKCLVTNFVSENINLVPEVGLHLHIRPLGGEDL